MSTPTRSLTVQEAAALIGDRLNGVPPSRRTMTNMVNKGLPHMKLGGRLWFSADEVSAWVDKHKRGQR